jgi:hypothetical protein
MTEIVIMEELLSGIRNIPYLKENSRQLDSIFERITNLRMSMRPQSGHDISSRGTREEFESSS